MTLTIIICVSTLIAIIIISRILPGTAVAGFIPAYRRKKKSLLPPATAWHADSNGNCNEEELRKCSLGSLFIAEHQGCVNTMETGIEQTEREAILLNLFGIDNHDSAVFTLNSLSAVPSQQVFHFAYEASLKGKEGEKWLRNAKELTGKADFRDECINAMRKIRKMSKRIIKAELACSEFDLGHLGITAWDTGRLNAVSRICREQGYINDEECQAFMDSAFDTAHKAFTNWEEYAYSYAIGWALAMGSTDIKGLANELLCNPKSPWTYVEW